MNKQTPAFLNYSIIPYGYNRIFSLPSGGRDRIKKDLEKFSLHAVLQFCAKLGLLLFAKGVTNFDFQTGASKVIFSKEFRTKLIEVITKDSKTKDSSTQRPFVIFHEQSLLYLAKEALINSSLKKGYRVNPKNVERLGILLLVATDVCLGWEEKNKLILPPEFEADRVRESLAKYSFFQLTDNFRDQYARFFLIFREANKIAENRGVDLEEIFTKATNGVDLPTFLTLTFALLVNWFQGRTREPNVNEEWIFCKGKYFKKTKLDRAQIEKILKFLSIDIADFKILHQTNIQNVLKGQDVPEYNFLVFQQKPLILYRHERFICISPRFLTERATEGIYWIIEYFLKAKGYPEWEKLPDIWGSAYENYTNTIFSAIFGNKYTCNFKDSRGLERADGLFIGRKIMGLVQIKYTHWRYATKITGRKQDMMEDLAHLIKGGQSPKGLGQHARDIAAYLNGEWSINESNLWTRRILPILIVGETMPMDAINRRFYETVAIQAGLDFPKEMVLPFIILDAEDIELLERYSNTFGSDAAEDLLVGYSQIFANKDFSGYSPNSIGFKNFIHSQGKQLVPNKRLLKVFDAQADKAREDAFGIKTESEESKKEVTG